MSLKSIIDKRLPRVASIFRYLRDLWFVRSLRTYHVPLGYEMTGIEGMAQSRIDSGEVGMLLELLDRVEVFVDVGANCGVFTLTARNHGKRTVAVEPNLQNYNILLKNLRRNNFGDVEAHLLAMGSQQDILPLFGGGEGASLEQNWGGMLSTYSKLVSVNTVDNLVGSRFSDKRLLIKIDVEGHEYAVLQGAVATLAQVPAPLWLLEHGFHENFGGKINPHFKDLFNIFWGNGYECRTADSEKKLVTGENVDRWIASNHRDFGSLNYLFTKLAS